METPRTEIVSNMIRLHIICISVITMGMFLCSSCIFESENLLGKDIRLFKKTPVWALAKAVEKEDVDKIRYLIQEKKVPIDFQEPKFGETILWWATYIGKEQSVKTLLELGADPNLQDFYDGNSAMMIASGASHYDFPNLCNSTLLRLMLKYEGDPNSVQQANKQKERIGERTPLTMASSVCLEKVRILVEAGADINYVNEYGWENPLKRALLRKKADIVKYLLIDKKANYHNAEKIIRDNGDVSTIVNMLRNWLFPLDSEEYKIKMEIVDYMLQQGEDYWAEPIPQDYLKKYPKEYLEKY